MSELVTYVFAPRPVLRRTKWWKPPEWGWERVVKIELAEPGSTANSYKPIQTLVDTVVPCSEDAASGCFIGRGRPMVV